MTSPDRNPAGRVTTRSRSPPSQGGALINALQQLLDLVAPIAGGILDKDQLGTTGRRPLSPASPCRDTAHTGGRSERTGQDLRAFWLQLRRVPLDEAHDIAGSQWDKVTGPSPKHAVRNCRMNGT